MAEDPVDVLIIGAGAAGAAFAWSLAETRMNILCLEQGDWMDPARYPTAGFDWEMRALGDFALSPNSRKRPEDYPVNDAGSPIAISMFNAVGGSTILYAGHYPRLHPSDFRVRTLDGVAEDWPIDYATLAPYYAENDRMTGIAGLAGDPAYPPKELPLPPVPLGRLGETIARGFNTLGWHWWPSDSAIATRAYEGRAPCINLGPCITGCAQGAKASTDVTYWPAAVRRGVRLATRCRVREITLGRDGRADGACITTRRATAQAAGRDRRARLQRHRDAAPAAPLALGAFPDGLANRSGLVGRNLMFHPYAMIVGGFPERLDGYKGPTGCGLMSQEFYETDLSRGFVRGYSFELFRGMGPLSTALWGVVERPPALGRSTPRGVCGRFAPHRRRARDLRGSARAREPRDARPAADRRQRHPGAAHRVSAERELPAHARARRGARQAGARSGRRRVDARRVAAARGGLAPDGHRAHGPGSGALGGERVGALARRSQSHDHRRQRIRDGGGGEPDVHDPGFRALRRRPTPEAARGGPRLSEGASGTEA